MLSVQNIYDSIAPSFDKTRTAIWPGVARFLDGLQPNACVLDFGCGNGKYLTYRNDLNMIGCDISEAQVLIASSKSGKHVAHLQG